MKSAHVLLFDGYADWEIGNLLAELRRLGQVEVKTCGFSTAPVISMGGLKVTPDISLSEIRLEEILIFVLPGGDLWENDYPKAEIDDALRRIETAGIPIAAICAATTVLAKAGLLQGRKHTSNALQYIENMVQGYRGHRDYVDQLAVTDRHITTASGLGAVDFTMQVLSELNLSTPETRSIWFNAFKYGTFPDDLGHSS